MAGNMFINAFLHDSGNGGGRALTSSLLVDEEVGLDAAVLDGPGYAGKQVRWRLFKLKIYWVTTYTNLHQKLARVTLETLISQK